MTRTQILSTLIFSLCTLLMGCGTGELTRSKAEDLLREQYNYPYVEFGKVYLTRVVSKRNGINKVVKYRTATQAIMVDITPLVERGLVLREEGKMRGPRGWVQNYLYSIPYSTVKYAKPGFSVGSGTKAGTTIQAAICLRDLGEITGIRMDGDGKSATIEFTSLRSGFTVFDLFLDYSLQKQISHSMRARLYDDGWRLVIPEADRNEQFVSEDDFESLKPIQF